MLITCLVNGQYRISHTITREEIEKCETGKGHCYLVSINRKTLEDLLLITFPDYGSLSQIYLYTDSSFKMLAESNFEQSAFIRQSGKAQKEGFQKIDMTGLSDGMYKAYIYPSDREKAIKISIYTRNTDCPPPSTQLTANLFLQFRKGCLNLKEGKLI